MNEKYGGLVSNPRNTKDTQVVKSITYTTNGTVVETVNLNAWPAATESNTPSPTPGLFYKTIDGHNFACNESGELAWIRRDGEVKVFQGYPMNMGASNPGSLSPLMAEPIHEIEGSSLETFTYLDWTFTAEQYTWEISPVLQELP